MRDHNYFVYILTNALRTVLYVGVTNDLRNRLYQHKKGRGDKEHFTARYYCHHLVYYERFAHIEDAIAREKEIKKWRREKKIALIESFNSDWRFLDDEI